MSRAYPSTKDSGIVWLGDVPSHWSVHRLRYLVRLNPSRAEVAGRDREEQVSFVPMEAVGEQGELDLSRTRPIGEIETGYTYFRDDDVAFAKITPCFENGKGAIMRHLEGGIGFGTTELTVLRANSGQAEPEYLLWLVSSPAFRKLGEAGMYGAGGQKRVPDDFVRDFAMAFPPLPEQRGIAAFLDRETGKIDALVEEQRRLIALLKEKRQAVISHAVTKGLDPDALAKPSGIDWLGDIPTHWRLTTLGRSSVSKCDGPFGSGLKSEHYTDEGVRVVRLQNIKAGRFDATDEAFISTEYYAQALAGRDVVADDLLVAGLGDDANVVGRACTAPAHIEPAMVKADCFRFRLDREACDPLFVALQLSAGARADAGLLSSGSTRSRISLSKMATRRMALPPLPEQREITNWLIREGQKLAPLIEAAEEGILFS